VFFEAIEECTSVHGELTLHCGVMSVDGSATLADDVTGDKRSSQLRSSELRVKSLQQENEALIRVSEMLYYCWFLQSVRL